MGTIDTVFEQYNRANQALLRERFSEIALLESTPQLQDFTLTRFHSEKGLINAEYTAAAPELFPHVRQRLIDLGVVTEHNITSTEVRDKGTPQETYRAHLSYHGGKLQLMLIARLHGTKPSASTPAKHS